MPETIAQTPRKFTISETNLCSLQQALSLLSVDINCLKINSSGSPSIYYLWIMNIQKVSQIHPSWRNIIDGMSNRARQLLWMCGLCMKQHHSVTHAVQKGKMETYGPKFLYLMPSIYRFVCGYCVLYTWNLSVWSYKMSGETFWSGVWFSHEKDFKMGCKNQNWKHRPVNINVTCL
jgi:hypothetical protein